jgi:hypothetical protein
MWCWVWEMFQCMGNWFVEDGQAVKLKLKLPVYFCQFYEMVPGAN